MEMKNCKINVRGVWLIYGCEVLMDIGLLRIEMGNL